MGVRKDKRETADRLSALGTEQAEELAWLGELEVVTCGISIESVLSYLSLSFSLLRQSGLRVRRSWESQGKRINKMQKRMTASNNSIMKKKNDKQIKRRYCLQQGWFERRANPRKYNDCYRLGRTTGDPFFSRATLLGNMGARGD